MSHRASVAVRTARYVTAAVFAISFAGAPVVAVASGAPAGAASGTVTVNKQSVTMKFVYAHEVEGFFDPKKKDVEVLLSDVALSAKAKAMATERARLAQAGKLHAFEITINRSGKAISRSFRNKAFVGPSPSGIDSSDVLTVKKFAAKSIDATYKSSAEHDFFGDSYAFDVTFRADIVA